MSVGTMSLVFEYNMPELKTDDGKVVPDSTAKFVLLALADHANDEGEGAYPGVKRICKKTSMSSQTVCNALNALRHNGYTTLEGKSKSDTNNYTIHLAKLSQPLEFQPLESGDSNDKNRAIPAARVKPSVNHQLNREREAPSLDFKNMSVAQARKVPTLKMYADAAEFFPGSLLWEYVHGTITEKGLTAEKIRAAAIAWQAKGFKPSNVQGILEWAINGAPSNGNGSSQSQAKPAINESEIERTRRLIEEKDQFKKSAPPEGLRPQNLITGLAERKAIKK
jgi:helix-turn-helix protein